MDPAIVLDHSFTLFYYRDGTLPADLSVKTVMDTWTLQTGFPTLTVNRNYADNTAKLSQVNFKSIIPILDFNSKTDLLREGGNPERNHVLQHLRSKTALKVAWR